MILDLKTIKKWSLICCHYLYTGKRLLLFNLLFSSVDTWAFNCGNQAQTYSVSYPDGRPTKGIRCVKFQGAGWNVFVWYGEGNWGSGSYRHIGFNYGYDELNPEGPTGAARDIFGNGEAFSGKTDNLRAEVIGTGLAPNVIQISGDWNERWELIQNIDYLPLPRPKKCGHNFAEYQVRDRSGNRIGSGIRCYWSGVWFGTGDWNGGIYSHIGWNGGTYGLSNRPGAIDLCGPVFGNACNNFPSGSLKVSYHCGASRGFVVTGAWDEIWDLPKY
jgi:hypothetical protein